MNIGALNQRVKVFYLKVLDNSSGGKEGGWFWEMETWARITPRRGDKRQETSQIATGRPVMVEMYFRKDFQITAQTKLRFHDGFAENDVILSSVYNVNMAKRSLEIEGMLVKAQDDNHITGDYAPIDYAKQDYNVGEESELT